MRDSSTGIKLTLNVEQGNRYKETFTGKPAASPLTCCRDKGDTASLSWWDQLWPSWRYWCIWIVQRLFSLAHWINGSTRRTPHFVTLAFHCRPLWRSQSVSAEEGLQGRRPFICPWTTVFPRSESCLSPPRRFRSGGLAHLQQLCCVAVWGRHAGLHADGGELHQARGGTQHRGHALQRPLWAVPRWLHSAVHVCKWCGCMWLQLLCPLPRAWFGAMVKGTRTACTHGQNMQVWKQTEGEASGFRMFSTGTFAGNKQL